MVRSAAKNFQDVAIVTSPADYEAIAQEMKSERRFAFAGDQVAAGAEGICDHGGVRFGDCFDAGDGSRRRSDGEVRNWRAAGLSRDAAAVVPQGVRSCATARIRTRRLRSTATARARASPTASSFRARNSATTTSSICRRRGTWRRSSRSRCAPSSSTPIPAERPWLRHCRRPIKRALECDPVSAFGGVIGVNRPIDAATATEMAKLFLEVIAAPKFDA